MSVPPEDFDSLRRVLTLKRHELPPPGYFEHFSDKVIARIEAEGLAAGTAWWQRLFGELDARPVVACAYGFVIVGLLVVGLGASQTFEPTDSTAPVLAGPWFSQSPSPGTILTPTEPVAHQWLSEREQVSSFTPMISRTDSRFWFDGDQPRFERVSFNYR